MAGVGGLPIPLWAKADRVYPNTKQSKFPFDGAVQAACAILGLLESS